MAKTRKVERFAVVLPDGTKSDVDNGLVKKYGLKPGKVTPFSRAGTTMVSRTIEQKSGAKDWSKEDDAYLMEHWDTVAKAELARRLEVSQAALTKRHKALKAELAKQKKAQKKGSSKARKKPASRSKKTK
jgi:hypothetical protein